MKDLCRRELLGHKGCNESLGDKQPEKLYLKFTQQNKKGLASIG